MVNAENDEWPVELDDAAAAHGLGPFLMWQRSDLKRAATWYLALPFVASAVLLILGLRMAVDDQQTQGSWTYSLPLLVVGLLPAIFGLYLLFRVRSAPTRWIGIYQNGLISQVGLQDPVALAWSEIDFVSRSDTAVNINGSYHHTNHHTVIRGADVAIVVDDAFGAVVELSEEITARSGKEMRRRLGDLIESGGHADFGLLGLTREGVTAQGSLLPWSRIGDVRVRNGQLRITEPGEHKPWASYLASGFPNLGVFLALSHSLRAANRE